MPLLVPITYCMGHKNVPVYKALFVGAEMETGSEYIASHSYRAQRKGKKKQLREAGNAIEGKREYNYTQ